MAKHIALRANHVSKQFTLASGELIDAIQDLSFTVGDKEFVTLVGPSGCGKSTLLKILAGLTEPTSGSVLDTSTSRRGKLGSHRGVVFQQYSIFPWLTVQENIGFGLMMLRVPEKKRREIVEHYVATMGLQGFEHARIQELSGGMQQRVALARTLATNPKILFMDEPFTALDVQTKRFMQDLLLQILRETPRAVVFVTHDVEEAVFLSDTVYILSARPGIIRERITVDLPRPRSLDTEYSKPFMSLKRHIQEVVTREALGLMHLNLDVYKNMNDRAHEVH